MALYIKAPQSIRGAFLNKENKFFTGYKIINNFRVGELFQNQYMVDAVNGLIDKFNRSAKETPLFEFQGNDFNTKNHPTLPRQSFSKHKKSSHRQYHLQRSGNVRQYHLYKNWLSLFHLY